MWVNFYKLNTHLLRRWLFKYFFSLKYFFTSLVIIFKMYNSSLCNLIKIGVFFEWGK